jgi:hypothetical protein
MKAESSSLLEKNRIFDKSLLRDDNFVEFSLPSRLNDPDEQNLLPIRYFFFKMQRKGTVSRVQNYLNLISFKSPWYGHMAPDINFFF